MTRTIIYTLAALASCISAAAQTPDTLRVRNVNEVTIITSANSQTISLKGSANDSTFRYESSVSITPDSNVSVREGRLDLFSWDILDKVRNKDRQEEIDPYELAEEVSNSVPVRSKPRTVNTYSTGYFGAGFALTHDGPEGFQFASKPFSEIYLNAFGVDFRFLQKHVILTTGLDVGYRSYRSADEGMLALESGLVVHQPASEGQNVKFSSLRSNFLSVPAILTVNLSPRHHIGFFGGAAMDFNFNGRIKNKYYQNNEKYKKKYENLKLEPFTWDYIAGFRMGDLSIYGKYSPCPFLLEGQAPAFRTWSIGILFNLE